MEEHQNVRLSTGSSELNRSNYTGNSLSALHSSQQFHDDTVSTSVHPLVSTQQINDTTPSCSALGLSYYTATSAHLFLRAPLATSQVKQCQPRSLRPSRSSHSWSLYSAATSELLLLSRLSYQSPFHSWTSLCRPPHHVKSLRILPPRRRTSLSPRYLLTRQCRRFSTVSVPHPWMLPCRRSHTVLPKDVSTQFGSRPASSFSVDTSVQTPIRCVVQHDAATQLPLTEFFIGCIYSNSPLDRQNPVRQSPPSVQDPHVLPQPPPGLEQPVPPLSLLLVRTCSPTLTALPAISSSRLSVPLTWEHTLYPPLSAPKGVPVPP